MSVRSEEKEVSITIQRVQVPTVQIRAVHGDVATAGGPEELDSLVPSTTTGGSSRSQGVIALVRVAGEAASGVRREAGPASTTTATDTHTGGHSHLQDRVVAALSLVWFRQVVPGTTAATTTTCDA